MKINPINSISGPRVSQTHHVLASKEIVSSPQRYRQGKLIIPAQPDRICVRFLRIDIPRSCVPAGSEGTMFVDYSFDSEKEG